MPSIESDLKNSASTARVFFALWPDSAVRGVLADLAHQAGEVTQGRITPQASLHLTLIFLGEVPISQLASIKSVLNLKTAAFNFTLDVINYWRDNHIVWLGSKTAELSLLNLHAELAQQLKSAGFKFDKRPYVPHITLVRNAARPFPKKLIPPVIWNAEELVLVQSKLSPQGSEYQILERWRLK
jgi:2'-5' RNA ligase